VSEAVGVVRVIARLNTGGPAIHTVLLTAGLDASRFRSVLVTGAVAPTEGDMTYYATQHGVAPRVIRGFGRRVGAAGMLRSLLDLFRIMCAERPRIVHTHTATAGILGRATALAYNALARLSGRPRAAIVHTFHGHVLHGYFNARVTSALCLVERALAAWTDRIIAVSEAVKDDLVSRYRICSADRITVVPLGLDFGWAAGLQKHAGAFRGEHGIPADVVTLGIVARLTGIKHHDLFLDALARLDDPRCRGIVIGDGERRNELQARAATVLPADRPAIFTGWEADQGKIYAGLDIVCLTSRNEGTPVALIEAMAAGRPFVATDVGGVRDLAVGEPTKDPRGFEVFGNGIVVRAGDADAFAAALGVLVRDEGLRAAMGATGKAVAMTRYGKERLIKDVESVYDSLLGRRGEVQCGR
jgi:glycosyltransferase involved in cell wall biosynthesis